MVRPALAAVVVALACSATLAQQAPNPAGHWVGSVSMPNMAIDFELDLARSTAGDITGTLSMPAQKLRGLPLTKIQVNGAGVMFEARTDQSFAGMLSADGSTMSGYYQIQDYTFPFTLTRMGTAKIDPPSTSPRISSELEGTWNGALTLSNTRMRVVLKLTNRPDGTSAGTLTNLDQGSLQIPVATITQAGPQVTLGFTVIEGNFTGTLNAGRAELTGTFMQGGASVPLTFTRQAAGR